MQNRYSVCHVHACHHGTIKIFQVTQIKFLDLWISTNFILGIKMGQVDLGIWFACTTLVVNMAFMLHAHESFLEQRKHLDPKGSKVNIVPIPIGHIDLESRFLDLKWVKEHVLKDCRTPTSGRKWEWKKE